MRVVLSLLIAALLLGAGFLIACTFTDNTDDVVTTTTGEPEHVHSFTSTVVDPTCISQGYTRHTCECGYEMCDNVVDIAPDVHYWEPTLRVDPTCTATGAVLYECSLCAETKTEEIAILPHSLTEWATVTPAACLSDGEDERHCTGCDYAETRVVVALDHNWDDGVVTDPSCTASGKAVYTCERCLETRTEVIEKLPHSFSEWEVTVAPTCEEVGQEARSCSVCNFIETREVAALGHDLSDWTTYTAPTCASLGEERKTCSRCDEFEAREMAMLDHKWNSGEIIPASCLEAGCVLYTCDTCTQKKTETTQPATGHTLAGWETYTASTCESVGEERNECEDCDYYESRNLPLSDHIWDDGVVTEPTCLKDGFTTYTCTVCGDKKVEAGAAATGHVLGEWETHIAATCTTKGVERQYCTNDGCEYYESRETAITGHALGDWTNRTPATCTEIGVEYRACQNPNCNYEVTRDIAATGHSLGEWYNTTPSTCETLGEDRRDCDDCDYYETREVAMHNYVVVTVPATCTTHGYVETICNGTCGYHTVEYTEPTGHAWGDWVEGENYDSRECVKCHATDIANKE